MTGRLTKLKDPTDAQLARKVDELVAAHRQAEDDLLRQRYEHQARTELTEELNRGFFDALLAEQHREAGWTFVADVWPTHPAAAHRVGESMRGVIATRPCGVRRPFRLAEDGVWFGDYWVCSPLYPAGRAPAGAIIVSFRVGEVWRQSVPRPLEFDRIHGGALSQGFEAERALGLRMNPEPLRGRPEYTPEPVRNDVFVDGGRMDFGAQAAADGAARSSADLLWRFLNATQRDTPWEVPAAS